MKELAKRKLSEFHRWLRVAGGCYRDIVFHDDWTITLKKELDPWNGWTDWRQYAPEEVNEIIKAVNGLSKECYRAIICLCYIDLGKQKQSEIMEYLGVKKSAYANAKNGALEEFAESYRSGVLID